jgi:hypothetical protein
MEKRVGFRSGGQRDAGVSWAGRPNGYGPTLRAADDLGWRRGEARAGSECCAWAEGAQNHG